MEFCQVTNNSLDITSNQPTTISLNTDPRDSLHNVVEDGDKGHDVFMNFFPTWINDLAQHHIGQNANHGHNGCAFGEFDLGPISHCHAPSLQVSSPQDGLAILPNDVQGDVFAECGAAIQTTEDLMLHVQQHYQQQPPFQQQHQYLNQFTDYMDLSQPFLVGDAADSPQVNGALASGGAQGRAVGVPSPNYSHGMYLAGLTHAITPAQHQNNKGNYRLSTAAINQGLQSSILDTKAFQAQGSPSVSEADTQECHGKSCLWHDSKDGLCGQICQDEEELEKHVQNDHVDKMPKTSELVQGVLREGFFCPWHGCSRKGESKPFEQKSKIRRHMVSHTGRKSQLAFPLNFRLMLTLSLDKPHVCSWPDCGHRFSAKQALSQHMLIHRDEKPLECPKCGMSFRQKSALSKFVSISIQRKCRITRSLLTFHLPQPCIFVHTPRPSR